MLPMEKDFHCGVPAREPVCAQRSPSKGLVCLCLFWRQLEVKPVSRAPYSPSRVENNHRVQQWGCTLAKKRPQQRKIPSRRHTDTSVMLQGRGNRCLELHQDPPENQDQDFMWGREVSATSHFSFGASFPFENSTAKVEISSSQRYTAANKKGQHLGMCLESLI